MSIKLGVLISGSGTNLQAIIDAIDAGKLDATVEIVISSNEQAGGLERAQKAGIQTMALTPDIYAFDAQMADEVIATELMRRKVDYVVLAGYMRMVREPILLAFKDRVINLHPALLPAFVGAHAIEDAWCAGVKITGVTVHFANELYDRGPIIAQRAVTIEEGMSLGQLEEAIHQVEHELLPQTLQLVAEGRVFIKGDRTVGILPEKQ